MARKCKVCKAQIPTASKSETIYHKLGFCGEEHTVQFGRDKAKATRERLQRKEQSEQRKAQAAERRAYNAAKRAMKDNDLSHQKDLTRKVCNQMIRLLDAGKDCPTCGKILIDGSYDAGHVRTVAACPSLRYDPRAIFGQCRACNGSGTIRKKTRKTQEAVSDLYKQWILANKGQEYYDWLYGPHEPKHYTVHDLKAMRAEFAAECRRLERGEGPSKDWRAL